MLDLLSKSRNALLCMHSLPNVARNVHCSLPGEQMLKEKTTNHRIIYAPVHEDDFIFQLECFPVVSKSCHRVYEKQVVTLQSAKRVKRLAKLSFLHFLVMTPLRPMMICIQGGLLLTSYHQFFAKP